MKVGVITLMIAMLLALPALAGPTECVGGDTDSDGIQHTCDNCSAKANPSQQDNDSDGCGNACDPDFNQDGIVAIADFGMLSVNFGLTVPPAPKTVDIAPDFRDGIIAIADFGLLSVMFGLPPGPSGKVSGTTACP